MITYKSCMLFALIGLSTMGTALAVSKPTPPAVTLDQAVLKVQNDTGGKVLSAESRGVGRRLEYRIKVLTPQGHVKVMVISSEASKNPASAQSTKNPPAKNAGSKEKH